MATFVKGDKIKPLVVLEEDMVEQEMDGLTVIGISKDKYPNLCEYLYVSFGDIILTRQLGGPDGESGMYSVVYHYPYPQEEGEPSDKMLTYSISYTIMGVSDDGNYYLCIPAVTTTFVTESNDEQLSSIELSRAATYEGYELSEDIKNNFKQNIGISGGADWNAQEGEPGYIENRTHSTKPYNKIVINDEDISTEYTLLDGLENNFAYQLEGYDKIFRAIAPETNKPIGNVEPNDWCHIDSFGPGFNIICSQGKIYIKNNYGYIEYKNITFWNENISQLDEIFIPNTVLKTTPQTLSDTDKNQALANLGVADLLEALKPVILSGFPPIGNVTQEQLDEVGLTEKVINNILSGYTDKIYMGTTLYRTTYANNNKIDPEFIITYFELNGRTGEFKTIGKFRYYKNSGEIITEMEEM